MKKLVFPLRALCLLLALLMLNALLSACGEPFYGTPGKGKNEVRMAYVIKREDLERAMDILAVAIARYRKEVMGV